MQFCRKFWGLVSMGRWKVIHSGTGTIVASRWTRSAAQDVSSDLNDALQFIGSKSQYVVRWM